MLASVTHLPARTPQPAPDESSSLLATMYEAGITEGRRQACEEFGIPYFPQPSARGRVLVLSSPGPA